MIWRRPGPLMRRLPDALCVHPETGAVIGFWIDAMAIFPSEWITHEELNHCDFLTVPIPPWLSDYAGHPFCRHVPAPSEEATA